MKSKDEFTKKAKLKIPISYKDMRKIRKIAGAAIKKGGRSMTRSALVREIVQAATEALGKGGSRERKGGAENCACPNSKCSEYGKAVPHQRGVPCNTMKCSKCGTALTGLGAPKSKIKKETAVMQGSSFKEGGDGSGHWGHKGRAGKWGGSAPGSAGVTTKVSFDDLQKAGIGGLGSIEGSLVNSPGKETRAYLSANVRHVGKDGKENHLMLVKSADSGLWSPVVVKRSEIKNYKVSGFPAWEMKTDVPKGGHIRESDKYSTVWMIKRRNTPATKYGKVIGYGEKLIYAPTKARSAKSFDEIEAGYPELFGKLGGLVAKSKREQKGNGKTVLTSGIIRSIMAEFGFEWIEEGGAGSGFWGHKGRKGKWGGSAPGGVASGGKINMEKYRKLSDGSKEGVLRKVVENYKERYTRIAQMKGAASEAVDLNKKIGAFEGIRRAYITKAGGLQGKEKRAVLHACVNLQNRASIAARQRDGILKMKKAA